MKRPTWNDPGISAGTMVRAALWLLDVVGEGNVFTKEEVRVAFPGMHRPIGESGTCVIMTG